MELGDNGGHYSLDCKCTLQRRLDLFLGSVLLSYKAPAKSPLSGRCSENLWVAGGSPRDLLPHVKLAVALTWLQAPKFRFKLTNDAQLLESTFGPDKKSEENLDLTGYSWRLLVSTQDLVICQMGVQMRRNVTAGPVFSQFLKERQAKGLPTWVLESDIKYDPNHRMWEPGVPHFVDSYYSSIQLSDYPSSKSYRDAYPPSQTYSKQNVDLAAAADLRRHSDDHSDYNHAPPIGDDFSQPALGKKKKKFTPRDDQ